VGLQQAEALADTPALRKVCLICSSPLERARETAQPLSLRLRVPVEVRDEFNELEFGEWTGRKLADLEAVPGWRSWNQERASARTPGGESMGEAQKRVLAGIRDVYQRRPSGAVVIVSHADVIKCAIMQYLGMSLDRFWTFDICPGSVTTVAVEEWGGRVLNLNVL
jgi:probable phosphoglycerate mutase